MPQAAAPLRHAIVPAGGRGTRMRPLSVAVPKELLPVGRLPVVEHVVGELAAAGVEHVTIVTATGKHALEDHLEARAVEHGDWPALAAVRQPVPRGLGDAILRAAPWCGDEPFAIALGDALLPADGALVRRLGAAIAAGAEAAVAVEAVPADHVGAYGVVSPTAAGAEAARAAERGAAIGEPIPLAGLVEKPDPGSAPSRLVVAARYAAGPSLVRALRETSPGRGGEVQLTDALDRLARDGRTVVAVPLLPGEQRRDAGTLDGWWRACIDAALADEEHGAAIRAHLRARLTTP